MTKPEAVIRELLTALESRPYHWLGPADKTAIKKARIFLGIPLEEDDEQWQT